MLDEQSCDNIAKPYKKLFKNSTSLIVSLPNAFLHYRNALGLSNLYQQHHINHVTALQDIFSASTIIKDIYLHRLYNIAQMLCIPHSPLLLRNFSAFTKTKIFRTDSLFRILFFSHRIGISFADPAEASLSVDHHPIYEFFHNNSTLFAKSLQSITRSNIQFLHQCSSADSSAMMYYKDAFHMNNPLLRASPITPNWYKHVIKQVAHPNSNRILSQFVRNSPTSCPLNRVDTPSRNYRPSFWCAKWNLKTYQPIIGKAIYTDTKSFKYQHWSLATSSHPNTTRLTPGSQMLTLQRCSGCQLHNDTNTRSSNHYIHSFLCRIVTEHHNVIQLNVKTLERFDPSSDSAVFNSTYNNVTSDIHASFTTTPTLSSPSSSLIPSPSGDSFDDGQLSLSFIDNSSTRRINTQARAITKDIYDALNFNNLLDLSRWRNDITPFSDASDINWPATWDLFKFHTNHKKCSTSFKHSAKVTFATKLMLNELPLQDNLVKRRPDIYSSDIMCPLCDQEQESWDHLWTCSVLTPSLVTIRDATKLTMFQHIQDHVLGFTSTFVNTWDNLPCWSLPSSDSTSSSFTFDFLVRGFIHSTLFDTIHTIVDKKVTSTIINHQIAAAQSLFKRTVWATRCELFQDWESGRNITSSQKHASSSGYSRNSSTQTSRSTTALSSHRWRSWIVSAIDTGKPWLGFQMHINNLILRLVQ